MNEQAIELFARAREMHGEAPTTFLAEACGNDTALRREVERLLSEEELPGAPAGDAEEGVFKDESWLPSWLNPLEGEPGEEG